MISFTNTKITTYNPTIRKRGPSEVTSQVTASWFQLLYKKLNQNDEATHPTLGRMFERGYRGREKGLRVPTLGLK